MKKYTRIHLCLNRLPLGGRTPYITSQNRLRTPELPIKDVPLTSENSLVEDLKVLRRSPDLFNHVEIGQGQLQLIIKHILLYHIWGLQPFWSSDLKQSNEYSIKQLSDI